MNAVLNEYEVSIQDPESAAPGDAASVRSSSVGGSVAHGALAMLTTQPVTWGVTLLGVAFGPKLFGADGLGQVTVAVTIATIGATIAGLGISEYLVRRVAQQPATLQRDINIAHTVQLATGLLAVLVLGVAGSVFAASSFEYALLLVALLPTLATPARTVLLSTFRGTEQHKKYAWFNATGHVASTLGSLSVLACGGNVVAATAAHGLLLVLTTMLWWRTSGLHLELPSLTRATFSEFAHFVHSGLPFLSWQLAQMAYTQIDRLLLAAMVPAAEVGWYAAANRIVTIPIFVPTLIVTPLFPALSRSIQNPAVLRRSIRQALTYTLLATVPLSAGTIVVAPAVPVVLRWPTEFLNAVTPMAILSLQLPLMGVGMILGSTLMALGRERRLVVVAFIATGFNVAFNLAFIPYFEALTGNGGTGAAIVSIGSEIVMLVGALILIPKNLLDVGIVFDAAKIGLAGLATAIVGVIIEPMSLVGCILAGALTYALLAKALRLVTMKEVRMATLVMGRKLRGSVDQVGQ